MIDNYVIFLKNCKKELLKKIEIARQQDINDKKKKNTKLAIKNFKPEEIHYLKNQWEHLQMIYSEMNEIKRLLKDAKSSKKKEPTTEKRKTITTGTLINESTPTTENKQ